MTEMEVRKETERKTKAELDELLKRGTRVKHLSGDDVYDRTWWRRAVRNIDPIL